MSIQKLENSGILIYVSNIHTELQYIYAHNHIIYNDPNKEEVV